MRNQPVNPPGDNLSLVDLAFGKARAWFTAAATVGITVVAPECRSPASGSSSSLPEAVQKISCGVWVKCYEVGRTSPSFFAYGIAWFATKKRRESGRPD